MHWKQLSDKLLTSTRVFDLHVKRMQSNQRDYADDFYYIKVVDWVNIIALTEDKKVVLVEQYRFGVSALSLELPGGMIDAKEDPKASAVRELREETGYELKQADSLGWVHPNPAVQTNKCHFFYGKGAKLIGSQKLDPAEEIKVLLVPLEDIPRYIDEHRVTHSLMVCALLKFLKIAA